jgi:hypothetical protein
MLKLTPKIRGDGNLDPTRSQCKRPTRRNLEKALEAVRRLPPDSQDEIALAMLTLSGNEGEPEEAAAARLRQRAKTKSRAACPCRDRRVTAPIVILSAAKDLMAIANGVLVEMA